MRRICIFLFSVSLVAPLMAHAAPDQRSSHQKKEQAEKKGALKERVDPAKDEKAQQANVKELRQNAEAERKNGNRVGAWAAEGDAKHADKLIAKDKELVKKGESKHAVDGQSVKK